MPEAETGEPRGLNDSEFGENRENWKKQKETRTEATTGAERRGDSVRAGVCAGRTARQRGAEAEGPLGTSAPATIVYGCFA